VRASRLAELMRDCLRHGTAALDCQAERLMPNLVAARIELMRPRLERERAALAQAIMGALGRCNQVLDAQAGQLEALSHVRVLERGYVIVRSRATGQVVPRLAALGGESELELIFADGGLPVRRADARGRTPTRRSAGEQGSLL
jgi:exonuclease VII large subunit